MEEIRFHLELCRLEHNHLIGNQATYSHYFISSVQVDCMLGRFSLLNGPQELYHPYGAICLNKNSLSFVAETCIDGFEFGEE